MWLKNIKMQENNSYRGDQEPGFSQRSNNILYNNQTPITTPPQNTSRSHSLMSLGGRVQESSNSIKRNISNIINGFHPLMHHARNAETHGRSIRSCLRSNHSEQGPSSSNSDCIVINFENIHEPSSSYSNNLYSANHNSPNPDQYQTDFSCLELPSGNDIQNQSNRQQENSFSLSNNFNNISDNNSNNNNVNNIPNNQTNEGTQPDNPSFTPTTENQSMEKLLNKYFPLITFLLMKAVHEHRKGIFIFIGLLVTFTHANSVVKREIAKQSRKSLLSLGILFVNLFVCICFIYFVFREQRLYKNLIFILPYTQPLNIWDVLWIVGITDFVLKFITIQLKVGMACFPAKIIPYSARGKWYLMLESTSQLYRTFVPIQPWLYYLNETYKGPEQVVGFLFSFAYMVCKGSDLTSKVKLFMKAFWKLLQNTSLGDRPSKQELDFIGSQCPICHDEYTSPIILHCRHVFCESCVTTWFDREQTCPLCRAKVADDPSWRDGATSFFIQLF